MAINDEREDYRRDYDNNRDRNRRYARDRGQRSTYRDTPRGRNNSNLGAIVRDVDRFAYSLTRAGARVYFGTVGALGDLVVNLADSLYASPYGLDSRRSRDGDTSRTRAQSQDRYDRNDRYDRSDRYDRNDRNDRYDRPGERDSGASLSSDITGNLRQAIRDTADIWSDSAREFSDVFHDEQERDDDIDAQVNAAEDEAVAARPERPRNRTRPSAPPESTPTPTPTSPERKDPL